MSHLHLPALTIWLTIAMTIVGCDKPKPLLPTGASAATLPHSGQKPAESRGALLYSTHCNACHAAEIHWREKKLVTDLDSLGFQVRRWQASIQLGWTEEEVADAVRYLNAVYYGFPDAGQKSFLEDGKPIQALRKNE